MGQWIADRLEARLQPEEIGVFVRNEEQLERAIVPVYEAGTKPVVLDDQSISTQGCISVSAMPQAKSLEFCTVAVMACDDEVLPLQSRIEGVAGESDLQAICNTEWHLLYVVCTRAKEYLLITGIDPVSEFLDDLAIG